MKILTCYLGKDNYIDNVISPFYGSSNNNKRIIKEEKYSANLKIIKIYQDDLFWADSKKINEIYSEIALYLNKVISSSETIFFSDSTGYLENNRINNYFKLLKGLKKNKINTSFYEKTICSEEINILQNDKIQFAALFSLKKNLLKELFVEKFFDGKVNFDFFISKRLFNKNEELLKIIQLMKNNSFGLNPYIMYLCKNKDIFYSVNGNSHDGIFGIDILGEENLIDLIYKELNQNNSELIKVSI